LHRSQTRNSTERSAYGVIDSSGNRKQSDHAGDGNSQTKQSQH
jgi:hypothetical protein